MNGGNGNMMPGQGGKFPNNALLQLLQKQLPGMGPINGAPFNPAARDVGKNYYRPPSGPAPSGNPAERPPNVGGGGAPIGSGGLSPPPPSQPLSHLPGMQPGQYTTGRTGDGSQTPMMTPDVQAWINHMLHGPGINTGWRQTAHLDPNNIMQSIEQASGQKYVPGGWQMPMPGVGY